MLEQYLAISNDYLRALVVFIAFLFVFRVAFMIIERLALKFASKTETDLDDKLIEKSSKPLTFLALLFSLLLSLEEITLTDSLVSISINVIQSLIILSFAYLIYAFVNTLIVSGIKKVARKTHSKVDDTLISLFNSVLNIALIVVSLLFILSLWGIAITPLLAGLGIAGLAVALALQPILTNIFSGASVVLDSSVRANDLVYIDKETKGRILKVGLRSTRILTFDNELVIIPNTKLAESIIQNVALPEPKSRVVIPFSVAYRSKIEKVKEVVLKEIKTINNLVEDPEPQVRFLEMADSGLNFKAYFYVSSFEHRFESIDEANTKIYDALNKAKIEIPFPQMDVHLKK